jgi:tetrapyrrole methylase family protein/MazG family protein
MRLGTSDDPYYSAAEVDDASEGNLEVGPQSDTLPSAMPRKRMAASESIAPRSTIPEGRVPMVTDTDSTRPPGTPPESAAVREAFHELCGVIARLRAPDGCPWDRVQTLKSIGPYTLEETYELLEAIDADDTPAIREELGDVLLQVVLDAQIAADEGRFDIIDVIRNLTAKMVHRHPHVFGAASAETPEDVRTHWEQAKRREKRRESRLDGVPLALPALARTARLSKKAAQAGYDWPDRAMLFDKLREELEELQAELYPDGVIPQVLAGVDTPIVPDEPIRDAARRDHVEEELGDLLFVVANIARRWEINPEEALRRSNEKFSRRFRAIEAGLAECGLTFETATLVQLEQLYQAAKRRGC